MASIIHHKRVEFTELFYDLVFVYAISKLTGLIHHLHYGVVPQEAIIVFLFSLLVLVNSWMIQMVFTNRFGKNSPLNMLVMFTNMGLLLYISNMISTEWQDNYHAFCFAVGTLSLTLFLQYLIEYFRKGIAPETKQSIRSFLWMTGLRTFAVYLAALLPLEIGSPIYVAGVLITFIMPITQTRKGSHFSINLPHLIERLSLLVIIIFGEMIMGLTAFFTRETFSFQSVCYFAIMALLFLYYFGQFDHVIEETQEKNGIFIIYSHYPIFIGLIMITVSMSFLADSEVIHQFATNFLYAGIGLFLLGVLYNSRFNKKQYQFPESYYFYTQNLIFVGGFAVSAFIAPTPTFVSLVTAVTLLLLEAHFIYFYLKNTDEKIKFF